MSDTGPESTPAQESAAQDVLNAAETARTLLATEALTRAVEKTAREARELRTTVRRGKRVITAMAVSFALDILITAGLGWNSVQVCRSGNQSRAGQLQIWERLALNSKPPPGATPAQARADRRAVAADLAFIQRVLAPRNCAAAYKLP